MTKQEFKSKQIECKNNHTGPRNKCVHCSSKNLCEELNKKLFGDLQNLENPLYIWKDLKDLEYKETI
jgi:hypothetical protein